MSLQHTYVLGAVLFASSALAHGPHTQISLDDSNQIVVRQIVTTSSAPSSLSGFATLTDPTSVHVLPVSVVDRPTNAFHTQVTVQPDAEYHTGGGGISFRYDQYTPGTNMFNTDAPVGKIDLAGSYFRLQYVSGLSRWDGSGFVDAGDTQLRTIRGAAGPAQQVMTSRDDEPASNFINFSTLNAPVPPASLPQNPHGYVTHVFLGDGVSTDSEVLDGIYKISLQFSSTAEGISASDPFDWVLFKGVGVTEAAAVAATLGGTIQVVPEPASVAVLGTLFGVLFSRRLARSA